MDTSGKTRTKGSWSVYVLAAETFFAFIWWSTFVEFLSTLWYFPLEKMDFSGWESFLGAYLLLLLLGVASIRSIVQRHNGKVRLVALLIAMGAFYPWDVSNPPFPISLFPEAVAARMALVATGVCLDLLAVFSVWWSSQPDRRERSALGFLLGLILHQIVRMEFSTVNPFTLWAVPIAFAAVGLVWACFVLDSEKWHEDSTRVATNSPSRVGYALGAQLFMTHLLFTTHGVAARHLDIDPFPWGVVVVFAFFVGAYLSSKHELVSSPVYFVGTAGLGTALFLVGEHGDGSMLSYVGLVGAALMGLYLASSWPHVAANFSTTARPGRAAGAFIFSYIVLILWSVWVVAFKFIPWWLGSGVLRERNRSLVALAMLMTSLGNVAWSARKKSPDSDSKARRASKGTSPRKEVVIVLGVLLVFGLVPATFHRLVHAPRNVAPSNAVAGSPSIINGMIWNIHFGYDNFGRNNFHGVAAAIKARNINVLGILESDTTRPIMANLDVVEFLAESLNMYSDYGPSTAKNTWGCGLLSSYPIESLKRIVLPSPEGELACLIDAVIRVDGEPVTVLVTHFGNTEDVLDRKLQTEGLADAAKNSTYPTIVLSYITDKPHSKNYQHILSVGGLTDTTDSLNRYCEYIFYKGLELLDFYRWVGDRLSDTEAQVGSWRLLKKN